MSSLPRFFFRAHPHIPSTCTLHTIPIVTPHTHYIIPLHSHTSIKLFTHTHKHTHPPQLVDSESEKDDLQRNLNQVRKKAAKVASEMNDLKLHLETQQARNAELEKRQRK